MSERERERRISPFLLTTLPPFSHFEILAHRSSAVDDKMTFSSTLLLSRLQC